MRDRAFHYLATILFLLLLAVVPAQAGPVSFSDVSTVGSQSGQGFGLRANAQDGKVTASGTSATTSSSLISTASAQQEGPGAVETIEQGDITGTICDCGEITVPGGGFPWWPFLGGVPAVCLTGVCTDSGKQCIPGTGNPDCETPIPEPASLLLLGTGLAALGAGARRRSRRRAEAVNQSTTAMEV